MTFQDVNVSHIQESSRNKRLLDLENSLLKERNEISTLQVEKDYISNKLKDNENKVMSNLFIRILTISIFYIVFCLNSSLLSPAKSQDTVQFGVFHIAKYIFITIMIFLKEITTLFPLILLRKKQFGYSHFAKKKIESSLASWTTSQESHLEKQRKLREVYG